MNRPTFVRITVLLTVAVAAGAMLRTEHRAHAADATVQIAGLAFAPASVTVTAGDTVTWVHNDGAVPHSVVFAGGPSSALLSQGQTYARTFESGGTFSYVCGVHPSMTGSVTVAAAQLPTNTPTAPPPTATATPPAPATATPPLPPTPTTVGATAVATDTPSPTPATGAVRTSTTAPDPMTPTPTSADSTAGAQATATAAGTPSAEGDDDGGNGSNRRIAIGAAIVLAALIGGAIAMGWLR